MELTGTLFKYIVFIKRYEKLNCKNLQFFFIRS